MIDDVKYCIYKVIENKLPITFEQFKQLFNDWEFIALNENNELIGAVMIKGNELHVNYIKMPKASILRHIKKTLATLINKYGSAVTSVMSDNKVGFNFCKRLGFEILHQEQGKIYMKCDRCNYV